MYSEREEMIFKKGFIKGAKSATNYISRNSGEQEMRDNNPRTLRTCNKLALNLAEMEQKLEKDMKECLFFKKAELK